MLHGASPIKEKIRAGIEWEASQDLKGLRSSLVLANYYCCFCFRICKVHIPPDSPHKERYSVRMGPDSVPFGWQNKCAHCVERPRRTISNAFQEYRSWYLWIGRGIRNGKCNMQKLLKIPIHLKRYLWSSCRLTGIYQYPDFTSQCCWTPSNSQDC